MRSNWDELWVYLIASKVVHWVLMVPSIILYMNTQMRSFYIFWIFYIFKEEKGEGEIVENRKKRRRKWRVDEGGGGGGIER